MFVHSLTLPRGKNSCFLFSHTTGLLAHTAKPSLSSLGCVSSCCPKILCEQGLFQEPVRIDPVQEASGRESALQRAKTENEGGNEVEAVIMKTGSPIIFVETISLVRPSLMVSVDT